MTSEITQEVVQACMAQTRLMEEVFFVRKLYRYGNAPVDNGRMNLFRQWGRSGTFKSQFNKVKLLFSPKFVTYYENFIENHEPRREDLIPHPWYVELAVTKGHGIFLDSGRSWTAV